MVHSKMYDLKIFNFASSRDFPSDAGIRKIAQKTRMLVNQIQGNINTTLLNLNKKQIKPQAMS